MKNKILASILAVALTTFLSGCGDKGTGEKIGIITKIAKQGIFCKTWEAEIVRGGFSGGTGVNGQSFHFTIESDEQAEEIRKAMEEQREVKVHYRSEIVSFCRSESGSNFLTKVEIVEKKAPEVTQGSSIGGNDDTITQLLKVQAQLIEQLAKRKE